MNHTDNDYKGQWIKILNKKYHPVNSWVIKFHTEEDIKKDNINIKTINKNQIDEYFNKQSDVIWLVDNNNNKIKATSQTDATQEAKTLRAVFSGHQLKVLSLKDDNNCFLIEVGVNSLLFKVKGFLKK